MKLNRENYTKISHSISEKAHERIVHIGLGAFHRAHQAWYTDKIDVNNEWGIVAFTGRTATTALKLQEQDGLYVLVTRSDSIDEFTVIDSIVRAEDIADTTKLISAISNPQTAIVTLTITEAGYGVDLMGQIDKSNPPATLTKLAYALEDRRRAHGLGIAIISCDNIPQNGKILSGALKQIFSSFGSEAEEWLEGQVEFVSTSVDRITPRTSQDDIQEVADKTGWQDALPVVTEPFSDWILEGNFPLGRPAWELAGAKFVENIEPFEKRKLWLLNGAHSSLAYAGLNTGLETVFDAISDGFCLDLVNEFWYEATRVLPQDILDLENYQKALLNRFRNQRIEHQLSQIAVDGLTKISLRIAPVALMNLRAGYLPQGCAKSIAHWISHVKDGAYKDSEAEKLRLALSKPEPEKALISLINVELLEFDHFMDEILEHCINQDK